MDSCRSADSSVECTPRAQRCLKDTSCLPDTEIASLGSASESPDSQIPCTALTWISQLYPIGQDPMAVRGWNSNAPAGYTTGRCMDSLRAIPLTETCGRIEDQVGLNEGESSLGCGTQPAAISWTRLDTTRVSTCHDVISSRESQSAIDPSNLIRNKVTQLSAFRAMRVVDSSRRVSPRCVL